MKPVMIFLCVTSHLDLRSLRSLLTLHTSHMKPASSIHRDIAGMEATAYTSMVVLACTIYKTDIYTPASHCVIACQKLYNTTAALRISVTFIAVGCGTDQT